MGYYDYLRQLLEPMGVYSFEDGSLQDAELRVLGEAMDECCGEVEELERECVVQTAESYGLDNYEKIMPKNYAYSTAARRRAIMAMLGVNNSSFTINALNNALSGCGEPTEVEEGSMASTVVVDFTDISTKPVNFSQLSRWVEGMLPCHLNVMYSFQTNQNT